KVFAGFFTDVIIEPRLDTGTPSEIIRFAVTELDDLLYVLQLLTTDLANKYPDDWDFSDLPIAVTFDKHGQFISDEAEKFFQEASSGTAPVQSVNGLEG